MLGQPVRVGSGVAAGERVIVSCKLSRKKFHSMRLATPRTSNQQDAPTLETDARRTCGHEVIESVVQGPQDAVKASKAVVSSLQ